MAEAAKKTAQKAPEKAPEKASGANLPKDAELSQTDATGHGTPEAKARVVEATGGPQQDEQSDPAREYADEGARQGFIEVKHDDSEPKGVEPGNEQPELLEALEKGYLGTQPDPTPNEHYTVAGVTAGKPTPENPEGRTGVVEDGKSK